MSDWAIWQPIILAIIATIGVISGGFFTYRAVMKKASGDLMVKVIEDRQIFTNQMQAERVTDRAELNAARSALNTAESGMITARRELLDCLTDRQEQQQKILKLEQEIEELRTKIVHAAPVTS